MWSGAPSLSVHTVSHALRRMSTTCYHGRMDTSDHSLRTIHDAAAHLDDLAAQTADGIRWRDQAVHDARAAGHTWQEIGDALGVTRQRALAIGRRHTRSGRE